jgi:myo-inositol 2-dehydrogenase/D-chiro-inositol 1-dehydrogenase
MKKLQFGLSGMGRIGKVHLQNVQQHSATVSIKGVYPANIKAKKWVEEQGVNHFYETFEDLVNDPEIDAVIIASPTAFHAEQIILAAQAGKALFAEKPIDLDREKVTKVLQVLQQTHVPFFLGFNRRFDPSIEQIKKNILNGHVGTPEIIKITSRDPAPPPLTYIPSSGGLFLDMAIHDFDMACHLMDQKVTEVYSTASVFGDPNIGKLGDIDTAVTTLTFENGAIAVIDNSRHAAYGYDQRIEVFGSKGLCGMDNHRINQSFLANAKGMHQPVPPNFFIERYAASYAKEMTLFVEHLLHKTKPSVGAIAGLRALDLALAAQQSVAEKKAITVSI